MTNTEERPSIGEKYTSATNSSNLRVTERRGDADMLAAAAWLEDVLGALLFRLRSEFESARGGIDNAERYAETLHGAYSDLLKEARAARLHRKMAVADKLQAQADELKNQMKAVIVTERALALSRLKTLPEVKRALFRFADQQATRQRFMEPSRSIALLVGQVIDVYLSPNCPVCSGRGFTGGAHKGDKQQICRPCHGTGHRKDAIGKSPGQTMFGRYLLAEMDRMLASAAAGMRRSLQAHTS